MTTPTIIIDRDTCTMILDAAELTADRVRPCVDAIADALKARFEERGIKIEIVREYRTTGRRDDSSDYHADFERVLVGQCSELREEVLGSQA